MSNATGLFCMNCDMETPEFPFRFRCASCGSSLEVRYDLVRLKDALSNSSTKSRSESFLKRWVDILPIDNIELIDKVSIRYNDHEREPFKCGACRAVSSGVRGQAVKS